MSLRTLVFATTSVLGFALWLRTAPSAPPRQAQDDSRKIALWAWERPEDLSFSNPREVIPAVLVGTLLLTGEEVEARPRLPPITLPKGSHPVAVVRIETDRRQPPALNRKQEQMAVEQILQWFDSPWAGLQIDFDATGSERSFYRALLLALHQQSGMHRPLSITALASWCLGDRWLHGLPLTEAVPMLFRMGKDARRVRALLARGEDFQEPLCRMSYGLSSDEPIPMLRPGRRLFLFHPENWTTTAYQEFRQRLSSNEAQMQ